ncbi:MAG: hypothetical protein SGI87_08085 [Flavobacteriales bacterium]|nr:hypothetical protein [Flavobacteriales bacterium]
MNNSKLFLGLLVGAILGTASTYIVMSKIKRDALGDYQARIDELIEGGTPPIFGDFDVMPSEPISSTYAEELIENYNCSSTAFMFAKNRTLKGWNIERSVINSLFNLYRERSPTGIQLYLGKHDEPNNKMHTLIWMACKDTIYVENGAQVETTILLKDKPNSIFQYVKPCPLNCPKNDITYECD